MPNTAIFAARSEIKTGSVLCIEKAINYLLIYYSLGSKTSFYSIVCNEKT